MGDDVTRIAKNYERFTRLVGSIGDRSGQATALIEAFGERLAMAPATTSNRYETSRPGGLVEHSLHVLINFRKQLAAYGVECPPESVIVTSLFHDIGKLGSPEEDLFVPEPDQWRRERYGPYRYSSNLPYMTMPLRSIWLLQKCGFPLELSEFQCILLNEGQYSEANRSYAGHESQLVVLFQQAEHNATLQAKLTE